MGLDEGATGMIIPEFNLNDTQWDAGEDGVYLSSDGWMIRTNGREEGPWQQIEFAEEAEPEFFIDD